MQDRWFWIIENTATGESLQWNQDIIIFADEDEAKEMLSLVPQSFREVAEIKHVIGFFDYKINYSEIREQVLEGDI